MTDIIGEGDLDTGTERTPCEDKHTEKCYVPKEAEIGVTYLQAKECQGFPAATRSQKRQEKILP